MTHELEMIPMASMKTIEDKDLEKGTIFTEDGLRSWKEVMKKFDLSSETIDLEIAEGFTAFVMAWQSDKAMMFGVMNPHHRKRGYDIFQCRIDRELYKYKGELWKKLSKTYTEFLEDNTKVFEIEDMVL